MNDIKKMIGLDYFSIKPYLTIKNILLFVVLSIFYSFLGNRPTIVFTMSILFATIFSGYPFLVGDESGIDSLYRIFGIKTYNVVYGRYISAFLLSIFSFVVGLILFFVSSLVLKHDINFSKDVIETILMFQFAFIFIVSLQYPLYFKYGYTKAKTLAILPFMFLGICVYIFSVFKKEILDIIMKIGKNGNLFIIVSTTILVLSIFLIVTSIMVSKKMYRKRDF